jgi:hypothetical protein
MESLDFFHFLIMWGSTCCALTLFFSEASNKLFKTTMFKYVTFGLLLFAGFSFATSFLRMYNFPGFDYLEDNLVELYKKKHELSELQRNVYLQLMETLSLFMCLILPQWYSKFDDRIAYLKNRLREEEDNYTRLVRKTSDMAGKKSE